MKEILAGFLLLISLHINAQDIENPHPNAVQSIDGIMKEVYNMISREKGDNPDWDAFRNLFLPTVRFTVLYHDDTFPQPVESASLEELIEMIQDPYYEEGFTQYETGRVVDEYNGIAHVFHSYYGKDSEDYEERGMAKLSTGIL